jgi:hypothetical protein
MEISATYTNSPNTKKDYSLMDSTRGTISPHQSPSPTPYRSPSPDNSTIAVLRRPVPSIESLHAYKIPSYLPDQHNNNALQAFSPDIREQNIIPRGQRSRRKAINSKVSSNFFTYYRTFAAALHPTLHQKITTIVLKTKLHQNQLPNPPKRFKDIANYP